MRNRRNTSAKTIKDYIVPIITFGLIFILIYVAFSWSDSENVDSNSTTSIVWENTNGITIKFDDSDTKATIISVDNNKTSISDWNSLIPWDTVVVEEGSVSFEIPGEAEMALNKNGELVYAKDSSILLNSSALWVRTQNDLIMGMKFGEVKIWENSIVNLEQNEVSSTVYLLSGTAEVENLAWVSTFLSQWKQLKISNQEASQDDIDLSLSKEDFDDYFKISDWYLQNNGSLILPNSSNETTDWEISLLWEDDSTTSLSWSTEIRTPVTTSNLISFDTIYDEGSVATPLTNISWKISNSSVVWIEISWKRAIINAETQTFNLAGVDTSKQANDIIVKVFDAWDNVIAKYLYTVYYSWGSTSAVPVTEWFAKINATAYPVNSSDFIISIPSVVNGETYSDENSMYWTVKNPDVASVLVNGFKLSTFNGSTFRYHAYKRFETLWEWVNNYEIKYLWADGSEILKKYITINKKTQAAVPASVVPVNVSTPQNNTLSDEEEPEL